MDSEDFEWVSIKMLAMGQRAKRDAEKAKMQGRHPGLIANLSAEAERCARIGRELLDIAQEEREIENEPNPRQ